MPTSGHSPRPGRWRGDLAAHDPSFTRRLDAPVHRERGAPPCELRTWGVFLAQALGYAAVRSGHSARFVTADGYFREMAHARVDHTAEKVFRSFLAPDLVIIDDLGLHRLTAQQSIDFYELVVGRHRRSSLVVTSNRGVDEWLGLFDDPILGNSALDRLANAAYQIVIEGESYRQRLSPHRSLLAGTAGEEVIDSTDAR